MTSSASFFSSNVKTKTFFDTLRGSIWAPFWRHFGDLGLTFGSKGCPWGGFGGSKNEVEKRDPPKECNKFNTGGVGSLIVIELGD